VLIELQGKLIEEQQQQAEEQTKAEATVEFLRERFAAELKAREDRKREARIPQERTAAAVEFLRAQLLEAQKHHADPEWQKLLKRFSDEERARFSDEDRARFATEIRERLAAERKKEEARIARKAEVQREIKVLRQREIEVAQRRTEAWEREEAGTQMEKMHTKHATLINQFYEIAERKISLRDDYGDERWDALDGEVLIVIGKIKARENSVRPNEVYEEFAGHLKQSFREYYEKQRQRPLQRADFTQMTGQDFEVYLMKLLTRLGYSVSGTSASGDQGADLLAKRDGRTFVIQAKNYSGPVGNSAVQEVHAAIRYYSGDEGWVITNSTFTQAAKDLAQRTGVELIDGHELARLSRPVMV